MGTVCGQLNSSDWPAGLTAGSLTPADTGQGELLLPLLGWCGSLLTLAHAHCVAAVSLLPAALFFSTKHANPGLAAFFLNNAVKHGNVCWVRRLRRLTSSKVFNLPPPSSPCTRRMQAASTVSVSLITASACRSDRATPVAAAAYALATAAVKDGCSFASAVAASQMQGGCAGFSPSLFMCE